MYQYQNQKRFPNFYEIIFSKKIGIKNNQNERLPGI